MYIGDADVSDATRETVDMILGCCPGSVFYSDTGTAMVLAADHTWTALVYRDGSVDSAYLAAEPVVEIMGAGSSCPVPLTDEVAEEFQGFRTGWEC